MPRIPASRRPQSPFPDPKHHTGDERVNKKKNLEEASKSTFPYTQQKLDCAMAVSNETNGVDGCPSRYSKSQSYDSLESVNRNSLFSVDLLRISLYPPVLRSRKEVCSRLVQNMDN